MHYGVYHLIPKAKVPNDDESLRLIPVHASC